MYLMLIEPVLYAKFCTCTILLNSYSRYCHSPYFKDKENVVTFPRRKNNEE